MTTPNLDLEQVPSNSLQPSVPINDALQVLDAVVQLSVETITATPPTTVSGDVGKRWIIAASATGAWATHDGEIALCTAADTWRFIVPAEGWRADVRDEDSLYRYDGSTWSEIAGSGGAEAIPFCYGVACSDLTTNLTTGAGKGYFRMPHAADNMTFRASLIDASSSGAVTVDINKNGSTILSTKLTIDASEKTSTTAATPYVATSDSCSDDDEYTFDIDGAGTDALGLIVWVCGDRA